MSILEGLKKDHPKRWEEAQAWIKNNQDFVIKCGWRWEFLRRSTAYREEATAAQNDAEFDRLAFVWGLPRDLPPQTGPAIKRLYAETGLPFPDLVAGVACHLTGKGWKSLARAYAETMARHDEEGLELPARTVTVKLDDNNRLHLNPLQFRAAWLIKVNIPKGAKIAPFMNELGKNPPARCFELVTEDDRIIFKVAMPPLQGWPLTIYGAAIPLDDIEKIVDAARAAYGRQLPGVNPWLEEGRESLTHCPKQVDALDVEAGLLKKENASFARSNNARILKAAKAKLARFEQAAMARRGVLPKH